MKRYIEELNYVPNDIKLAVIRRTALGSCRKELEDYLAEQVAANPGQFPAWEAVRRHLLNSFVALDIDKAHRAELEKVRQQRKHCPL